MNASNRNITCDPPIPNSDRDLGNEIAAAIVRNVSQTNDAPVVNIMVNNNHYEAITTNTNLQNCESVNLHTVSISDYVTPNSTETTPSQAEIVFFDDEENRTIPKALRSSERSARSMSSTTPAHTEVFLPSTSSEQEQNINTVPKDVIQSTSVETAASSSNQTNRISRNKWFKSLKRLFPSNKNQENAVNEVKRHQATLQQHKLELQGLQVSEEDIPTVHPQIFKVFFYEGEAMQRDEKYQPSRENMNDFERQTETTFDGLLTELSKYRFISLIGLPGSGKTTCTKRLSQHGEFFIFLLKCMDMNYGDKTLTLQELLLNKQFPELDSKTCKNAFKWILKHQSKVLIIIDGLDQAEWKIKQNSPKQDYSTKQNIGGLISNLCSGHFLPHARLLITSRPHTMLFIPNKLRPDATYLLHDLSMSDMKILFFAFAGSEAIRLWKNLNTNAPQLVSICLCPLILLLYIRAALAPSEIVGEIVTMTRIFATVLENLRRCDNMRCHDIKQIMTQLSRLAFKATQRGTVVITVEQLKAEGLEVELVQDLVITLHGYRGGSTCNIFEGDQRLYFCHQTFQEYFTALYISKEMPLQDFINFSLEMFSEDWIMVRKFLCGILMDLERESNNAIIQAKQQILLNAITQNMSGLAHKARLVADRCMDVRECNSNAVTEAAGAVFPSDVSLSFTRVSSSCAHAVSLVLRKATRCVNLLGLSLCDLDSTTFAHFSDAITNMPGSIRKLDITWNRLSDVDQIASFLHKIDGTLLMRDCFADDGKVGRSANQSERASLMEAFNDISNTNVKIVLESGLREGENEIILTKRS